MVPGAGTPQFVGYDDTQALAPNYRGLKVLDEIGMFGFVAMVVFLLVLVIGFIYEWKKGALEWE